MRIVKCYDCGKRYDYDDDGFCPGCGAFNTPGGTTRIGADGSVIRVDGINEQNHRNSFLHRELHAEARERRCLQPTREKAVRKRSHRAAGIAAAVGGKNGWKSGSGLVWVIAGIVILVNFILPLLVSVLAGW